MLADGRELVDGIASWWTACHGYNHSHIRAAVESQLAQMPHVMFGGLAHEPALTLAQRLAARLPGDLDRVFFSRSGSVAVEVAMKMAVQFWLNRGVRTRKKFLVFSGATTATPAERWRSAIPTPACTRRSAALSPSTTSSICRRTRRALRHSSTCSSATLRSSRASSSSRWCKGRSGMRFHDAAVLRALRAAADRYDLLLVFDEIFTGFGRTGALFACEAAGVVPDIVTLSKALTGGTLPLAATVASRKVFDAFYSDDPMHALMHGPTFMGNALACAAANASLDLFEREPRLRQVAEIAAALERGLAPTVARRGIKDVRVRGVGVVELDRIDDLEGLRARFVEEGVFVRPFGSIVYLTPAFTIAEEELARLTGAVVRSWLRCPGDVRPSCPGRAKRDRDPSREAQHRLRWR